MLCIFQVPNQVVAIPSDNLIEVIPKDQFTPLPLHNPRVIGLHAHRGQIITLISLAKMEVHEISQCKYVLVMSHPSGSIGIICERVFDVKKLDLNSNITSNFPLCSGTTTYQGRTIPVVDPDLALRLTHAVTHDTAH